MEVLLPYHIFIVFGWPFAPLALPDRRYPKQSLTWKPKSPWSQTQNGSAWQHFQQVWLSMTLLTLHSLIVFIISLHLGCLCPRAPESSRLSSTIHSFGIFQLGTFLESVILTKSIEIVFLLHRESLRSLEASPQAKNASPCLELDPPEPEEATQPASDSQVAESNRRHSLASSKPDAASRSPSRSACPSSGKTPGVPSVFWPYDELIFQC